METRNLDRIATSLDESWSRREALRLLSAVVLGAGGAGLIAAESEAKRAKPRKKSRKSQRVDSPGPHRFVDVAITAIFVEQTSEIGHDDLVVQFLNNGTASASGFRIGMAAQSANGQSRPEVISLPITLAPGQGGSERFRLGCKWINGATVTARTTPSPVQGEPGAETANNVATATFGAAICLLGTEGTTMPGPWH